MALLVFTQEWKVFLMVFVPARLLYVVSQVLRSLAEHRFGSAHPRSLAVAHGMTVDIYCAEKPPLIADHANHVHNALQWLCWAVRMIFIQMPTRFWVLTGSTPAHWQHHFARLGHDFANYEAEKGQSPARPGGTRRAWAGLPPDQVVSLPATSLTWAFAALGRFTMLSSAP